MTDTIAVNAVFIYNEICEPECTWQQHYGFSTYRRDDSFRGKMEPFDKLGIPVGKFEIQPILDVGQLPDFHYLPYTQLVLMLQYFHEKSLELPKFLRSPDYDLPSKNLDHVHKEESGVLEDPDKVELLSTLIGISVDEIHKYIKKNVDHEQVTAKRKLLKTPIKTLNCAV